MTDTTIEIRLHERLSDIAPQDWDACACPEGSARPIDPFTTHRFLKALEDSGSVGPGTGWAPRYLTAHAGGGLIAAAPLYAKSHSQGEYVFDHSWAARLGAGRRALLPQAADRGAVHPRHRAALPGAAGVRGAGHGRAGAGRGAGCGRERAVVAARDLLHRGRGAGRRGDGADPPRSARSSTGENNDYRAFDAFLDSLSSRKRKAIRKERRVAQGFGGEIVQLTGDALRPEHWDAFWALLPGHRQRANGGALPHPRRSSTLVQRDDGATTCCWCWRARGPRDRRGAQLHRRRRALWPLLGLQSSITRSCISSCATTRPSISRIAHGLARVEAGAQGEHKLARGYLPVATHSLHWIADAGFRNAVEEFVAHEAEAVDEDIEILTAMGPFKRRPD